MPPRRASKDATASQQPPTTNPYNLRSLHIPRSIRPGESFDERHYVPTRAQNQIQRMKERQEEFGLPALITSKTAIQKTHQDAAKKANSYRKRPAPSGRKSTTRSPSKTPSAKRVWFDITSLRDAPDSSVETTPLRAQSNAPRDESIIASLEADTNEETNDNEDSVSEDDDLPVVVPGRPPGWNMADYLNSEYDEEENRLLRDMPLNESTPFNSLDIKIAATNLYNAKEDFKKLSAKRCIKVAEHALREAREDISIVNTSDIQDEFNHEISQRDYSIGIDLRVYINKRKVISQTLHDMTRRSFDLGVVEDQFHDQIVKYTDDKPFTFETCMAFVKSMSGRGRQLSHQFDDFSITETLKVLDLIDNKREAHPGTALCVLFEIKVACEALISKKKRTAISTAQQPQDPISIPSSPPVLPTQIRSTRTTQLLEEAAIREARQDRILTAGDFQRQLMQKYQCNDRNCTNYNNFYFPDPMDNTQHYNILATQHELWANRIASGGATIENPLDKLKQYWTKKQEMQTKMYEQQMQYRLMEQMEAMQEKQEHRDEEKERRHLLREQRDLLT
ncbi:hypothetical protein TSTA_023480 [Talaromyces stipitatus ATCC 10500]|uniref:Uncharacterized protein n=1 Tax=Talaromyces stipitatus (strain ATCC 10500 / CBS 375.48 / QM 6759 / NRRL 1006) TaxID=441959 RepID=B8M613_TALSN|nr:uncharacterized protein TSTA_023480 [Talaromyces stipitatus ATCC 10500]EED19013.1 hypothetical protein TSTA_023480 [Talaromyces stipitatus ATCC 10500]